MPSTRRAAATRQQSALKSAPAPSQVLVDSGPLVALFNRHDPWHATVLSWLQAHQQTRLVSTWAVLTEVCALLSRRIHNAAALTALRWVAAGGVSLDQPAIGSLAGVLQAAQRFSDLPLDLADATLAEAASRLKITAVLTVDSDFDVYRDTAGKALVNLLRAPARRERR